MPFLPPTHRKDGTRLLCVTATFGLLLGLPFNGCRRAAQASGPTPEDLHRYALESELRDASAEEASFASAIRSQTHASEEMDAHIASDRQSLGELETVTRAYMQEHNVAVAAILAGAASTDVFADATTSEDAKQISVGVGVIVLLWAATHQEELSAVVHTLETSRDRRLALQQDVERAQKEQTAKLGQIDELKLRDDKARQKVAMLRTALCEPACSGGQ